MRDFKKWEDPTIGGMILKWGVDTPLQTIVLKKFLKQHPKEILRLADLTHYLSVHASVITVSGRFHVSDP